MWVHWQHEEDLGKCCPLMNEAGDAIINDVEKE